MKVVIPAAGAGKRLFPHTFTKPKPMVYIAGKPIIGHIFDRMRDLEPEEVILVVGYKKEQIISYVNENYSNDFNIKYVDQHEQLGLAHSIFTAKDEIGESEILIALGDNIFESNYSDLCELFSIENDYSGYIGVAEVDDPTKYGIVELNGEDVSKLEEKPKNSKSNIGIAGIYFIKDTGILMSILGEMIRNGIRTHGEYQLTDALQEMVSRGYRLKTFQVPKRLDCGRKEALIEANRLLLDEKKGIDDVFKINNTVIIQPVAIGENVTILNSVVGPHASIAKNTCIDNCIISNTVIGSQSKISKVNLQNSIIGDDARVCGNHNSLNIGDSSSIEF